MIYVIIGPPCAGKTTYIQEHKSDGDLVVDYDAIVLALGGKDHEADGLMRDTAVAIREKAVEMALNAPQYESWIIHSRPNDETLKRYYDAGCEVITLDPGIDVCLERAKQDGRPQSSIDGIRSWYAERKCKAGSRTMQYKTIELKVDEESGKIAGFFSTYEKTPDSYGDIIEPGAFTKTIEARKETGHPFPLCFNHNFDNVIGACNTMTEEEKGPYFEADFLDTQLAQDVRKMVKSGAIYQFSFAYDVVKSRKPNEEETKNGVLNVLQEVDVFEVSVVTVPANQNAQVTDIKSVIETAVKAGRRNSKSDEDTIKECIAMLQSLIEDRADDTEEEEPIEEEVTPEVNEASEEPKEEGNLKRISALLEKINSIKEVPENDD